MVDNSSVSKYQFTTFFMYSKQGSSKYKQLNKKTKDGNDTNHNKFLNL